MNAFDKAVSFFAPRMAAKRVAWRRSEMLQRALPGLNGRLAPLNAYDGATRGHRSAGWRPVATDVNGEVGAAAARLRDVARDMCRNIPYAKRARDVIVSNTIGTGILPTVNAKAARLNKALEEKLVQHFDTTDVDATGRHDLYGLQALAMATIVESGEVLIRRRQRRPSDGLAVPFQLEVLEPDFLDTNIDGDLKSGNIAIQGIEYDKIGRLVAYHIFSAHPGGSTTSTPDSHRVPAEFVAHIYRTERPGQARGVTWFAPVMMVLNDLMGYRDAQLMRQKIAACFAAFVETDNSELIDLNEETPSGHPIEAFEPGMVERLAPGETVKFSAPPPTSDYQAFLSNTLHEVASGLGISYEALTGDLAGVNFSSGRMGWLEFQRSIDAWRNHMLFPQMLHRIGDWFIDGAALAGVHGTPRDKPSIKWTPPRREMISPKDEIAPMVTAVRSGFMSRSEVLRRSGFDPVEVDTEVAEDNKRVDELELIYDSDPRVRAANGGTVATSEGKETEPEPDEEEPQPAEPAPDDKPEEEGKDE